MIRVVAISLCCCLLTAVLPAQKRFLNPDFSPAHSNFSLSVLPSWADNEPRCDSVASAAFARGIDPQVVFDTHDIRRALIRDLTAYSIAARLSGVSYANDELSAFPSLFEVLSEFEAEQLWLTAGSPDYLLVPAKCEYRTVPMGGQHYCNISYEMRLYHFPEGEMVLVMRGDTGHAGASAEEAAASAERKFVSELVSFIGPRL